MAGRRILYLALLIGAAFLHIAYGQYTTHIILMFLLALPVLSLLLALPAAFSSRAELRGCEDVHRGDKAAVRLKTNCPNFLLIPSAWKIKIELCNIFTGEKPQRTKVVFKSSQISEKALIPSTERIGAVKCSLRYARICDPLGLFALPVKRSGNFTFMVLPHEEIPVPEPDLVEASTMVSRPKPGGFSEEHELREYREGDSVNLIHWKLTMKMDQPIVREPQESMHKNVILFADIPADPVTAESIFGKTIYLGRKLSEEEIPFILHFGHNIAAMNTEAELDRFIREQLSKPLVMENAVPAREGTDTVVYRIYTHKEAQDRV